MAVSTEIKDLSDMAKVKVKVSRYRPGQAKRVPGC